VVTVMATSIMANELLDAIRERMLPRAKRAASAHRALSLVWPKPLCL